MRNARRRQAGWLISAMLAGAALWSGGCAVGTTRVKISHGQLDPVESRREGKILVRRFVDAREAGKRPYIGNKRNGFGAVLGHLAAPEGVQIEQLLSEYFAEALRQAGYDAVVETSSGDAGSDLSGYDAVLEGRVQEFWLDLYMNVWHNIVVAVSLVNPDSQNVVWQKDIKASEVNPLWVGATSEFERIVSQTITHALNQAATEFASEEFYRSTKSAK
jgi:hypothetical protein